MNGEGGSDRDERPKRSWREIDRQRDRPRESHERRPRGAAAEARSRAAAKQYLKHLDGMFSGGKGGGEAQRLARAIRDAHGTPELDAACRAYLDAIGIPEQLALLSLFLDARDRELRVAALDALAQLCDAGGLEATGGLRTQLRVLAQELDDEIAERAEELLEQL